MELERITLFDEKEVKIKPMSLEDANKLMVPVSNTVSRLLMGEADLFSHWSQKDLIVLQQLVCKYVFFKDTDKNINLFDISANVGDFLGLQFEFLEFNFKVFSQSRKILKRINGQLIETE